MTNAMLLSDLLARRVNLAWHEGGAVVRGVAERLLERQGTAVHVPELHHIELSAGGRLAVSGGLSGDPVRRLGQLLQAMVTDPQVPVQLRLIVAQATAPMPIYRSVAEFDLALAYFERPDRAGVLTALFVRAEAAELIS